MISELPPTLAELGDELERAMRADLLAADTPSPKRTFRRAAARHRRRFLAALAGTTGAATAVVTALVLTAGAAPSAAQALPILSSPAAHIRNPTVLRALRTLDGSGTWTTHTFTGPDGGTGYVEESQDGSKLCVDYTPPSPSAPSSGPTQTPTGECDGTADLALHGIIMSWNWTPGNYDFYAVVPTGGSVSLTANGTTSAVPVDANGIAVGVVHDNATVSLQIGSSNQVMQLGPTGPAADPTVETGPTA
jgi:hypothetical protein